MQLDPEGIAILLEHVTDLASTGEARPLTARERKEAHDLLKRLDVQSRASRLVLDAHRRGAADAADTVAVIDAATERLEAILRPVAPSVVEVTP